MTQYTLTEHEETVRGISSQVEAYHATATPFHINHGSTNSTRKRPASTLTINIAHLNHILFISDVSAARLFAVVEPNVPLDVLVAACTPLGLVPPVVMEFPGITVGGGFSGASGESSSFKHGLFDCTIDAVEIILADGKVVRAEKDGNFSDLFQAARCSLGTMGVVTLLEIRLMKAKEFVLNTYTPIHSLKEMMKSLKMQCHHQDNDYVEGIMFSPDFGIAITGKLVDRDNPAVCGLPVQRFARAKDPWFYLHAFDCASASTKTMPSADLTPLQEYLFRYDRGAFWAGRTFFRYFRLPFTRPFRWLFDSLLRTRSIYKAMQATGTADEYIVQDLVVPLKGVESFVHWVDFNLQIWPIWLCPVRKMDKGEGVCMAPFNTFSPSSIASSAADGDQAIRQCNPVYGHLEAGVDIDTDSDLYINLGVWGDYPPNTADKPWDPVGTNRALEAALSDVNGMKVLYAHVFYTEHEFWHLFDQSRYEELRDRYGACTLPSVWDKVKMKKGKAEEDNEVGDIAAVRGWGETIIAIWPFAGLYQYWRVLTG